MLKKPENFFVVVILLVGIFNLVITPLGAGFDEETHLGRIWEMANGEIIPNRLLGLGEHYPAVFFHNSYRQYKNLNPVSWGMWLEQFKQKIDTQDVMSYQTRAIYFPTLYLFQAVLMRVLWMFDAPIAILYIILRFSYLLLYVALTYLAIRILPFGRWLMVLLALSPMAIIQASTVTPDAIHNGASFLFIAWVLALCVRSQDVINRKQLIILGGLTLLVCTLKPNSIVLLLLLVLLPPARFGTRLRWAFFLLFTLSVVLIIFVGWNGLVSSQSALGTPLEQVSVQGQLQAILSDPLNFAWILASNFLIQFPHYWQEWIGVSGYGYWQLPVFVYWIYPFLLLLALLSDSADLSFKRVHRLLFVSVFFLSIFLVMFTLYVTYNPVGSTTIEGVQGRYYIGIVPLLSLALLPARSILKRPITPWLQSGILLLGGISFAALFLNYHFVCGTAYFVSKSCTLPYYKNWSPNDGEALPITGIASVKQSFYPVCNELTQVRLWVSNRGRLDGDGLLIELLDGETEEVLVQEIVWQVDIPEQDWLIFDVGRFSDAKNKGFIVKIRPQDRERPQDVALTTFLSDQYFEGKALLNNNDLHTDLMFQYVCQINIMDFVK